MKSELPTTNNNTPLVSIMMLTYNHAPYIAQAMDSVLSQITEFPFELVVCDDASTDDTANIVNQYAKKYNNIVFLQQPVNGRAANNFLDGIRYIRSKYIAFCEGDDYWKSPYKLEKQIRFLEENPDFSVSCHKVEMQFDNRPGNEKKQYIYKDLSADEERIRQGIFYADEAIANYFFQTSSFVFRWRFRDGLPSWFRKWMMYDHAMLMLHAVEGKIKYFDEALSVWRRNETGYSWLQTIDRGIFFQKEGCSWIEFYTEMDNFFSGRFHLQIRERILLALRNMISNYLETGNLEAARNLIHENREWCLKLVKDNIELFDTIQQAFPEKITRIPPWANNHKNESKSIKSTIGGFKELDLKSISETPNSVLSIWTQGKEFATFSNPLAALISWIYNKRVRVLWLPTITPISITKELSRLWMPYQFYPVGGDLSPSIDFIKKTQPGDAVLTVSWNGRPPSSELREALVQRKDIFWIDDRSEALWPDTPYEADVALYSPAKVLGVPDGGILIGHGVAPLQPELNPNNVIALQRRELLLERFENPVINGDLLAKEQAVNLEHPLPDGAMSNLSSSILARIPLRSIAEKCQENWHILFTHLAKYALWPECETATFAPSSFPLMTPASIPTVFFLTALNRKGIVCHTIPTIQNKNGLGEELQLLQRILLLPCDHRYGKNDMENIASEFLKIIQGKSDLGVSGERFNPI